MDKQIFLSYRRADTEFAVSVLHDVLTEHFGEASVFVDDKIVAGNDFPLRLEIELKGSDIVLAVIGPQWLAELKRREGGEEVDYVYLEIAEAFKLELTVIPILCGARTEMPASSDLPGPLKPLSSQHAFRIRAGSEMRRDISELVRLLESRRNAGKHDGKGPLGAMLRGIPAGSFIMGSDPRHDPEASELEYPRKRIRISRGFWMADAPLTIAEFERGVSRDKFAEVMRRYPPDYVHHKRDRMPVTYIDWHEATDFCQRLNQEQLANAQTSLACPIDYCFRLPFEVEWEYACRAGNSHDPRYVPAEQLDTIAHTRDTGGRFAEVGLLRANRFKLYDMIGLVYEWCDDIPNLTQRIVRGGSYCDGKRYARAAARRPMPAGRRSGRIGMRIVLAPRQPAFSVTE